MNSRRIPSALGSLVSICLVALVWPARASAETAATPAAPRPASTAPPQVFQPAGTLGEIAKRNRQQREEQPAPKKSLGTITNESLRKNPAGTPAPAAPSTAPAKTGKKPAKGASPAGTPKPTPVTAMAPVTDLAGRTEADWRDLMKANTTRIAEGETRVKELEGRAARLENDFYAWSDGTYRDRVIKPDWDKAKEALQAAREDLDLARQETENLKETARKSGTPPGWLR